MSTFFVQPVNAATLGLSASVSKVNAGDLVTVTVSLNTNSKTINNAEASVFFPVDLVEVVSLSSQGSIFPLWVEQPNFSNANGKISFSGGIPSPGFTGSGKVVSIIFRTKKAGTASFYFSGAAVRENDGLGTNILTGQGSTSVEITTVSEEKPKPPTEDQDKPKEPTEPTLPTEEKIPPESGASQGGIVLYSTTHPDQNMWYSAKAATFAWKVPSTAKAVQTLVGSFPDSTPTILYRPPIYRKDVSNLTDGVWYFHLRYQDGSGWSKTSHYRIQIDSAPPTDLSVASNESPEGEISLAVKAKDALSGMNYYNIIIDNQESIKVPVDLANEPIILPALSLGSHRVVVEAYDNAGNKVDKDITVLVEPKIAPVITKYPEEIDIGNAITIEGSTVYSEAKIKIILRNEFNYESIKEVIADKDGNFVYVSGPISVAGSYEFWAYAEGLNNNSPLSAIHEFKISQQLEVKPIENKLDYWIEKIPKVDVNYLSKVLNIILILVVAYFLYLIITLKRRLNFAEKKNDQTFKLLVSKANKQIESIEKLVKRHKTKPGDKEALDELKGIIDEIKDTKKSRKK
ncbi:MAG: hypothetical protein KAZ30_00715 [Candidatus Magasanikbacteria bacterium]|nr:hypothetical protein [Candidatus Magasanikbacteria bacterium]